MSKSTLIVAGHPGLKSNSLASKAILEEAEKALPEVELDTLSDLCPDCQIDIAAERDKLQKTDVIIFQYPLYWYMTSFLLNRWIEKVFVHDFSHGSTGDALEGRHLVASLTTGAEEAAYSSESDTTIDDLLAPVRLTAKLTQLNYAGHIVTHGVSYSLREDTSKAREVVARSQEHAQKLVVLVNDL